MRATPIEIHVAGDAVNPRTESRATLEPGKRLPDPSERLLCEVGSIGAVARKPPEKSVDAFMIILDEPRCRDDVAVARRSNQSIGLLRIHQCPLDESYRMLRVDKIIFATGNISKAGGQ